MTEYIKKNWKAGWFPIEKVADRMVEPKHPAYGSQETSRRSAATLSQLQSWRNFSKPFPFIFSIWMSTFLIASYLENLLKTAFFLNCNTFPNPHISFQHSEQPQFLFNMILYYKINRTRLDNWTPISWKESPHKKTRLDQSSILRRRFLKMQWSWRHMMIMSESTNWSPLKRC